MRSQGDRRFAEGLSEGIKDTTPVLFCKDEGGYVKATFFPTRKDFVDGTNQQPLGALAPRSARATARRLRAALVEF